MFEYRKLKGRIKEKFDTQERFANALGTTLKTVNFKLSGKSGFSQSDIIAWSKLLDIEPDDYAAYFFA